MRRSLLLLPLLLALAGFAPAEEEASPHKAFRHKVTGFPAPGAEGAFMVEGRFVIAEGDVGSFRFSAEAAEHLGKPVWRVRDRVDLKLATGTLEVESEAILDARLSVLRGERVENRNGTVKHVRWERTETGFTMTTRHEENGAEEQLSIEHEGRALTSISGLILFCRLAMPEKGQYAAPVFLPSPSPGEGQIQEAMLTFEGTGDWKEEKLFLVSGNQGRQKLTIALDPESRRFRGIKVVSANGFVAEMLAEKEPEPEPEPQPEPEPRPEDPVDRLEAALLDPPATGLLVTGVVGGSQAQQKGVQPGDVVVSYAGEPATTVEALNAAKERVAGLVFVKLVLVRGGEVLTLDFTPGAIGVLLKPVTKGEPAEPLPAATGVRFDLSSLEESPRDEWYSFLLNGVQVGFEHGTVRLEDGKLLLEREVAFDGGERWGVNHFAVTVEATAEARPTILRTRFENIRTGYVAEGRRQPGEDGTANWHFNWRVGEQSGVRDSACRADTLAEYMVETMAGFMPREKGASFHFRPLGEGMGLPGLPAALICVGQVDLEHEGGTVKAWLFEQRRLGGTVVGRYHVDDAGRTLFVDYGGAKARLATKEKALAGVPEGIEPRTAK